MSEPIKKNDIIKYATVGNNGQVSIGKEFAGRQVQIERTTEGAIVISPGRFIPDRHAPFYTKEALNDLDEFDKWADATSKRDTDVKELRAKLKGLRDKK